MLTNATIVLSKALECAYDAQKTHITQTCPDTLHGRVGMHTRCTNSAQVMHVKCALNARRSGSLRPLLLVLCKKREAHTAHRPKKARGALSMHPDDGINVDDEGDGEEFDEDLEME